MYLLAASPAEDWRYPATLYRVVEGKLQLVREVLPPNKGPDYVEAWGNTIFLVHWKDLTVLHTDDPLRLDDVVIDADREPVPTQIDGKEIRNVPRIFINLYELLLAETRPAGVDVLLPVSKGDSDHVDLMSVSSNPAASPRTRLNEWNDFASLRRGGAVGGPIEMMTATRQIIFAEVMGDDLVIYNVRAEKTVKIDSLLPFVLDALDKVPRPAWMTRPRATLLAASARYLLLTGQQPDATRTDQMELYLHDRLRNLWKTIRVEGGRSRFRLLGPWLTVIVGLPNPERRPSPGRENERGPEAFGEYEIAGSKGNPGYARFPCVRCLYDDEILHPGILVLQNLEDDRKIRIETGQEDSEILSVQDGTVLYRVNDTIYQAAIQGSQLRNISVVSQDKNVPEVHWVFWSARLPPDFVPAPRASYPWPTKRITVDSDVQARRLVYQVPPVIPPFARRIRDIGGTITVRALIGKDGSVTSMGAILSDNPNFPILAMPASQAVRQWRYEPTLVDGDPVEVETTITVTFPSGP